MVSGDAVVGATLIAEASMLDAEEGLSRFEWFRASSPSEILSRMQTYVVTSDDLSHDLNVRVTPVTASGAVGEPLRASPSHPIAVPANVHSKLREWHGIGQKSFTGCFEGDKERQVLFEHGKLKLKDKSGKTIAKSDSYAAVTLKLDFVQSPHAFTLSLGTKKGNASYHLTAPPGVRDLIALTLVVFADARRLDAMPVAPASATNSLHLSAVGSISTPKVEGGGNSPASSQTSEQQSIADVDDAAAYHGAGGGSATNPTVTASGGGAHAASGKARASSSGLSKIAATGRKLSFSRNPKKGK